MCRLGTNGSDQAVSVHRLPYDTTAAARARALVADEVTSILDPGRVDDARLMVAEVASNAVQHGSPESDGRIVLEIEHEPGVVRIIIRDGGRHMDLNEPAFHTHADGHYGLFVVDSLADQWGFSIDGDKGVWFEVNAPR